VDEYSIGLLAEGNRTLYGEPVKGGEMVDILRIGVRRPAPV